MVIKFTGECVLKPDGQMDRQGKSDRQKHRQINGQSETVGQKETQTGGQTDGQTRQTDRQGGLWLPMSRLQYEGEVLEATPQRDKL